MSVLWCVQESNTLLYLITEANSEPTNTDAWPERPEECVKIQAVSDFVFYNTNIFEKSIKCLCY